MPRVGHALLAGVLALAPGPIATFAWDEFHWSALLGAAGSLVLFCALVLWWARTLLRRRSIPPA